MSKTETVSSTETTKATTNTETTEAISRVDATKAATSAKTTKATTDATTIKSVSSAETTKATTSAETTKAAIGVETVEAATLIVVPAYNEERALPGVLTELAEELPRVGVVVVDDGSSDDTSDVARAAGANVIVLPFNIGIGGALRAGFRYADEHGFGVAVQFDADGQHHADQVRLLLNAVAEGAHLVIGNRFSADEYRVGALRRLAMALLRLGVRLLCGQRFGDPSSGFRAVAQPLLKAWASDYPVEYMDSAETLVASCRSGYRVTEVPVKMGPRTAGTASTGPIRLVYHYVRLAVALAGGSRRSLPSPPP